MSAPSPVDNPYLSPPTERYSPKLTKRERDVLIGFLNFRERFPLRRSLSQNLVGSLWSIPVALTFIAVVAGAAHLATDVPLRSLGGLFFAAFASVIGGSLFRDLLDAMNTQTLWELQNRVTDFDEVERALYDRNEPVVFEEPLAAIPVEEESAVPGLSERERSGGPSHV